MYMGMCVGMKTQSWCSVTHIQSVSEGLQQTAQFGVAIVAGHFPILLLVLGQEVVLCDLVAWQTAE